MISASGQRAAERRLVRRARLGRHPVDLVEDEEARHVAGADLVEHLRGDRQLALEAGIRRVDDVRQERRLERLGERALERGDEPVRQLLDEADCVGHEDARPRLGHERAHGRLERREELVGDVHRAAGEGAHERRLAGVRVADEGDAARSRRRARCVRRSCSSDDSSAVSSAIRSRIFRRSSSRPDSPAPLPPTPRAGGRARALLAEAGRHVLQPDDLHLRPRGARLRVAVEDLEDHRRPIHDHGAGRLLEVPRLRRRDLMIHEDRVGRARRDQLLQLLELPGAEDRARIECRAPLRAGAGDGEAERLREASQLGERLRELRLVDVGAVHGDQHRAVARPALGPRTSVEAGQYTGPPSQSERRLTPSRPAPYRSSCGGENRTPEARAHR
jgi:hypothetical protein